MAKRKLYPRVGQIYANRDALEDALVDSGWEWEGCGTQFEGGMEKGVTGFDVGVIDREKDVWLWIFMKPVSGGVKITRIKRMKVGGDDEAPKRRKKRGKK